MMKTINLNYQNTFELVAKYAKIKLMHEIFYCISEKFLAFKYQRIPKLFEYLFQI